MSEKRERTIRSTLGNKMNILSLHGHFFFLLPEEAWREGDG